ncbi:hypothetical protein FDP41_002796 [Naegleria fowleri]|uniref:procollagen-lysine 5-dioxygenase n=1 Tax=Naegleria fowleri TaxID=5763 RepID=A0A6A5BV29_NAEFO|nr:uncharacterized protein FDP41_002796 [Naegleria fowleri]KAF0978281.1 hypothetical protein FDP41_002796 [Naegleria fowleri]CAG4710602.1 unnamed protein product [Naegleria fowleri]
MNLSQLTPDLKLKLLSMLSASSSSSSSSSSPSSSTRTTSNKDIVSELDHTISKQDKQFILSVINSIQEQGYFIKDEFQPNDLTQQTKEQMIEMKTSLHQAGMGEGSTKYINSSLRGDLFKWISEHDVEENTPLRKTLSNLNRIRHVLNYVFNLQLDRNSIQIAFYSNGARYVRHADATPLQSPDRRLTFLLYFNDKSSIDGGSLQLYRKERSFDNEYRTPYEYQFKEISENQVTVKPLFNRLLAFSSEYYHEVLPSLSDRFSLTMWMYGHVDVWQRIREYSRTTIFVSICAYRDSELQHTLKDMFEKAYYPDRLRVGICLQVHENDSVNDEFDYRNQSYSHQIKEIIINYKSSKGPCFARFLIQKYLYQQEDYYLQIDSHMRFDDGWDVTLIKQLHQCEEEEKFTSNMSVKKSPLAISKCILTTYPVGYELPNKIPEHAQPTIMVAKSFTKDENGFEMLRLGARVMMQHLSKPVKSIFFAAGFAFSRGSLVLECPYEELPYLFFGEEMYMLEKFHSKAYQIYSPSEPIVYHLWSRSHRKALWQDQQEESSDRRMDIRWTLSWKSFVENHFKQFTKTTVVNIDSVEYESINDAEQIQCIKQHSQHMVQRKLKMINPPMTCSDDCSHPNEDSSSFFEYCGIDFTQRRIYEKAQRGGLPQHYTLI